MKKNVSELFDVAIEAMGKKVEELGVQGTGVVAYLEDSSTVDWNQTIHVFGKIEIPPNGDKGWNLIGMACSKAAETINTHMDSGKGSRPLMMGEVGFKGAAIRECNNGYVVAAFGGASDDQDYEIGTAGVNAMAAKLG